MRNVVIIREYDKNKDKLKCSELLRESIMSHTSSAFFTFLFKEVVLQVMVLLAAISFIFLGLPIYMCACVVPLVISSVYVITYTTHYFKGAQLSESQPLKRWVAEAFEPHFMTTNPKDVKYGVFNDYDYKSEDIDTAAYSSQIVGVVSIKDFYGPNNSVWLYGLAVSPNYQRKHIATMLVRRAVDSMKNKKYHTIEVSTTDMQNEARLLFQKEGFQMKQIYHRYIFGVVPMGKFQMSLRLNIF